MADLLDGEIDLAIFPDTGPHGQLVQTPLLSERLAVIGTRDALARLGSRPRLKSLQERPLVLLNRQFLMRQQIDRQLRLDGAELDVRLEVSSMDDAITAALPGQLLAIGSPLACRDQPTLSSRGAARAPSAAPCWPVLASRAPSGCRAAGLPGGRDPHQHRAGTASLMTRFMALA